ncbi:MAG: biopolymer transporter ExbD [Bacteroidetes bacterium 4572_117]|nr:MAG: biopolymer transporter ExbD [Bacteroidetes bacterium 4572_117]
MARPVQEINAGSMADIAFLLLIFFLVTTTMDVDSGITRKLSAIPPEDQPKPPDVKERNVYIVLINQHNQLAVEGELMSINKLCDGVKEFIKNPHDNKNLSEKKEPEEIQFLGMVARSKGVVSLQNDKGTSYHKYIEVQNELVRAFNELRNELSMKTFGMAFKDLANDKQASIKKAYPMTISEAEPRNIGGKK